MLGTLENKCHNIFVDRTALPYTVQTIWKMSRSECGFQILKKMKTDGLEGCSMCVWSMFTSVQSHEIL